MTRESKLFAYWSMPVMAIAALGPTLEGLPGLRLEHLVVFALAALAVLLHRRNSAGGFLLPIAVGCVLCLLVGGINTLQAASQNAYPIRNPATPLSRPADPITWMEALKGAAQLLLPLGAGIVALYAYNTLSEIEFRRALRATVAVLIVGLLINTGLVLLEVVARDQATQIVQLFLPSGESSAYLALAQGRFTGAFNHPAESGMAYTLGLLALPYFFRPMRHGDVWFALTAPVLLVGGALSFSKMLLAFGAPLAVLSWTAFSVRSGKPVLGPRGWWILTFCVAALVFAALSLMASLHISLDTFSHIASLINSEDQGVEGMVTGGRFSSSGGTVVYGIEQVLQRSPWWGLGFGSFLAYDNAYFLALAYCGIFGLGLYTVLVGWLVLTPNRRTTEGFWLQFIAIFVAFAGIGMPTFTAARCGVLLSIVTVSLLLLSRRTTTAQPEVLASSIGSYA